MTVNDLRALVNNLDEYIHIPGGIDRLRKTVVHLAVSGQLVPQDPREGTGADLYVQIQKEKSALVAVGKIKKQKPVPEISGDDCLYDIPENWTWVRLSAITYLITDGTHHTPHYKPKGIPFLSIKDVSAGLLDFSDCRYISREEHEEINKRCNPEFGDILFCRIGTLGRPVIVDTHDPFSIFVSLGLIKFNQQLILPEFLRLYLDAPATYKEYRRVMAGGSHTNKLNLNTMNNLVTVLPPVAEQERILERLADILRLLDDLANKYKAEEIERKKLVKSSLRAMTHDGSKLVLENLTSIIKTSSDVAELRKAILHMSISGQLVPQLPSEGTAEDLYRHIQSRKPKKQKPLPAINADEVPFDIPTSWKWVRLGEMSDIFNGNSISKSEKLLKYEKVVDGYPYLGTKDIGYGFERIDYDNGVRIPFDEHAFKIIPAGTALICSEGGSAGKKCGIVDREVAFGNKMYAFKAYENAVLPEFVLFNYLSDYFFIQFKNKMTGIIGGISSSSFRQLLLPLPPIDEQKRIVQKTNKLLDLVSELENHL